jgi:hypothetical protein
MIHLPLDLHFLMIHFAPDVPRTCHFPMIHLLDPALPDDPFAPDVPLDLLPDDHFHHLILHFR